MSRHTRRADFGWLEALAFVAVGALACSNADGEPDSKQPTAGAGGTFTGGTGGDSAGGAPVTPGGGRSMSSGASSGRGGREQASNAGRSGAGRAGASTGSGGRGAGGEGAEGNAAGAAGSAGDDQPGSGTETLFWLDVGGEVLRSNVTPFMVQTIVPSAGQGPDGIAVDVDAGHIYWTTMGNTADNDGAIRRSDLDGSGVITVVPEGGTFTPKQLKLEPMTQKLYWSDREGMQVQRSNLDGSEIEVLYTAGSGAQDRQDLSKHCVGIAVDIAGGFFYWSQKGSDNGHVGSLRRARLAMPAGENSENRSDVEILYDGLPEPIDIDLDVEQGFIYWTDRGDDTVNRGPIEVPSGTTAADRTDREILVPGVREAIGLALDHARGFVYYTSAVGDVGRARLDGSDAEPLLADGGAFTGIVMVDLP
jgi:hypothetical protein